MAHTTNWFGRAQEGQYGTTSARRVDWVTDTIKCALTTNTFVPDPDTHDFYADVTNELATAGGYTAGGATLTGKSVSYDTGTNETRLICADITWGPGATFGPFRKGIIYKDTGAAATSPLLGYITFDADQSVNNGTFTIDVDATGLLYTTVVTA
jgi:hypothetical protein